MSNSKKARRIFLISLTISILALLLTGFIILAVQVMQNPVLDIDKTFANFALDIRSDFLTIIFKLITNMVNPIIMGLIAVILLFVLKSKKSYLFALFLNMGIVALLNLALKTFFVRARPDMTESLITEVGYSFPSGHAMMAVGFYGFLIYLVYHVNLKKWLKITISTTLNILILAIAFSRIYLGVHYASDVFAGLYIATFYLIIYLFVLNKYKKDISDDRDKYKRHTFLRGFKYAFHGIITAIKEENNLLIQFAASMLVIVFSVFLRISPVEWCICLIMCFLVMTMEMINTALENICDRITGDKDEKIRKIKDIAAGAVLTMSICSAIIALTIFTPKIKMLFWLPL